MSSTPAQQALIRKAILNHLIGADKDIAREIADSMDNGQTVRIEDELGDPLGTIVKTQPNRDPVIDDPAAAFGFIAGLNPDYVDYLLPDPRKEPEKYLDAVDVLVAAGRFDLLTPTVSSGSEKVVTNAVKDHFREHRSLPTGWKFPETTSGSLRVTPSKEAKARAAELLQGSPALRALTQNDN